MALYTEEPDYQYGKTYPFGFLENDWCEVECQMYEQIRDAFDGKTVVEYISKTRTQCIIDLPPQSQIFNNAKFILVASDPETGYYTIKATVQLFAAPCNNSMECTEVTETIVCHIKLPDHNSIGDESAEMQSISAANNIMICTAFLTAIILGAFISNNIDNSNESGLQPHDAIPAETRNSLHNHLPIESDATPASEEDLSSIEPQEWYTSHP